MSSHPPSNEADVGPFGAYQLLDRVAVGGMAEVFRALAVGGQDAATRPACLPDR